MTSMTIQRGHQEVVSNDVWIDADPSGFYHTGLDCDDDLAILAAISLHTRQIINLSGLSIYGGNAPLRHTLNDAHILWRYINGYDLTGGITPLKGCGWQSMQVGVKLLQLYNYMFPDVHDSNDAVIAISNQLQQQKSNKTTAILALGPPTNTAKAIQHYEKTLGEWSITNNSHHIYLMGGELTNNQLDLNFRSDRASARTVIEANVPKTIIPIQTCGQVAVTQGWIQSLGCHNTGPDTDEGVVNNKHRLAVCAYLPKMKQQVQLMPKFVNRAVKQRMTPSPTNEHDVQYTAAAAWKASPNLDKGFIPWDIIALLAISHPEEFGNWRYHKVAFPYCEGTEPCDGTMQVVQDLGDDYFDSSSDGKKRNWSGVVRIPHTVVNETRMLDIMLDLIKSVKVSSDTEEPSMKLGFLPDLIGFGMATIIFLYCCLKLILYRGTK